MSMVGNIPDGLWLMFCYGFLMGLAISVFIVGSGYKTRPWKSCTKTQKKHTGVGFSLLIIGFLLIFFSIIHEYSMNPFFFISIIIILIFSLYYIFEGLKVSKEKTLETKEECQKRLENKYISKETEDVNYLTNGFENKHENRYSLRSKYGFYFEYRKLKAIIEILNEGKVDLSNMIILDVGCNKGLHLNSMAYLKGTSQGLMGADFSEKYLKIAEGINKSIKYQKQDLYNFDIKEKFDMVMFIYTLNEIRPLEERKKIIEEKLGEVSKKYILIFDFHLCYNSYGFDDKTVKEYFKDFEIITSKRFMNKYTYFLLKHFGYTFTQLCDLLLPKGYYICLLKRKNYERS